MNFKNIDPRLLESIHGKERKLRGNYFFKLVDSGSETCSMVHLAKTRSWRKSSRFFVARSDSMSERGPKKAGEEMYVLFFLRVLASLVVSRDRLRGGLAVLVVWPPEVVLDLDVLDLAVDCRDTLKRGEEQNG
eukprot:CAMPEP_0201666660 /NCGR_PEP_ID=MMETSP0494-20130426/9465_1 /ASSEMBLY_ACC=CAM_ASM_000839 /TAXON_ID=420259 /ORGANISM="Thalassiosira gravida, Strain GMp14c1" /LENGTH=132 /DNA_ID=CAMNT_0048146081 /DNA_START=39 /DNA_END=437 /DNA_ORIENTATION=-